MTNLQILNEISGLIRRSESYEIQVLTMTFNEDENIRTELNIYLYINGEYREDLNLNLKTIEESETDFDIKKVKHDKKLNTQKAKAIEYFGKLFDNVTDLGNNIF